MIPIFVLCLKILTHSHCRPIHTTYKKKHYSLAKFLDTAKTSYITQDAFPMQDNEINNECIANAKEIGLTIHKLVEL
jgi:hypothetical protein